MIANGKAPTVAHPGYVSDGKGRCFAQQINVPKPRQVDANRQLQARAKSKAARAARKRGR